MARKAAKNQPTTDKKKFAFCFVVMGRTAWTGKSAREIIDDVEGTIALYPDGALEQVTDFVANSQPGMLLDLAWTSGERNVLVFHLLE